MAKKRQHYYMGTVLVQYVRNDTPYTRYLNFVTALDDKKISASVIDNAKNAIILRMHQESDVPASDLRDVTFLTFSHLGFMTQEEFEDLEPEEPQIPKRFDA